MKITMKTSPSDVNKSELDQLETKCSEMGHLLDEFQLERALAFEKQMGISQPFAIIDGFLYLGNIIHCRNQQILENLEISMLLHEIN